MEIKKDGIVFSGLGITSLIEGEGGIACYGALVAGSRVLLLKRVCPALLSNDKVSSLVLLFASIAKQYFCQTSFLGDVCVF